MELVLNLVWFVLASVMVCLWFRFAPREGPSRRLQFVALALLVFVLFPVISVTDDLQEALNPAETDCCQRRDHACVHPHVHLPVIAALHLPDFAALSLGTARLDLPGHFAAPAVEVPALASIQNRPPPTA